jgi:hypothetical protein
MLVLFHEALFFDHQLEESLQCPNKMRAAGVTIKDALMRFDASSLQEINHSRNGQFQAIKLTDDIPWEPYSEELAKRESVSRASRSISAIHKGSPRPKPSPRHAAEGRRRRSYSQKRTARLRKQRQRKTIKGRRSPPETTFLNYNLPQN